jgi:two-component system chemotaxis sensor kinase CheA
MGRALAALSAGDEPVESAIDTLFRMAHSIKGMAASLDYDAVSSLAHRLEDWMEPLRAGAEFDRSQLDLLAEAIAALEEMVACVEEAGLPAAAREDLLPRASRRSARTRPRRRARSKKNSRDRSTAAPSYGSRSHGGDRPLPGRGRRADAGPRAPGGAASGGALLGRARRVR